MRTTKEQEQAHTALCLCPHALDEEPAKACVESASCLSIIFVFLLTLRCISINSCLFSDSGGPCVCSEEDTCVEMFHCKLVTVGVLQSDVHEKRFAPKKISMSLCGRDRENLNVFDFSCIFGLVLSVFSDCPFLLRQ